MDQKMKGGCGEMGGEERIRGEMREMKKRIVKRRKGKRRVLEGREEQRGERSEGEGRENGRGGERKGKGRR